MDRLFPLTGTHNFVGRKDILGNLIRNYQKELPSHIQVIGPHYTGKTALLKALEVELQKEKLLNAVVYWDLSGLLPKNDNDFLFELCRHLGTALKDIDNEASELLLDKDNLAEEAFDLLQDLACSGQVQPDTFLKEFSYSTGDWSSFDECSRSTL
jgi:AAA+ ATPase superfamily predicted ATPase